MNNKEIIEENAKEPRDVDSDLEEILHIIKIPKNDVKNILAAVYGENDGADWHYIVEFVDGTYGYLTGGCDYTGWGCQDWAETKKRGSKEECIGEIPEKEEYFQRGNIREAIKKQLSHELPFGVIES